VTAMNVQAHPSHDVEVEGQDGDAPRVVRLEREEGRGRKEAPRLGPTRSAQAAAAWVKSS